MTKFNTARTPATPGTGPITTVANPATGQVTHVNAQGGVGYGRDAKSDLFLLATTSHDLTGKTFYEGGDARVERFKGLVREVAVADPDWTYRFLTWLRTKGNIRTAALVGGVEAARALAEAGIPGGRHMTSTVLRRPDEPAEAIAYHLQAYGRAEPREARNGVLAAPRMPMAVKRGIADAAARMYNERALLKWDTDSHAIRFGDVLALTHAKADPGKPWQADLFRYAIDRRYGRPYAGAADEHPRLPMIELNARVRADWANGDYAVDSADFESLIADAGMTWEDVLSALGGKVDKATLWRAWINSGSMGLMAAIRNLRNLDEAGLSDADVQPVIDMLLDADQVRASKQLPLRFLSAYRAAPSLRWSHPLERALDVAVENIPALTGRTLILIDTSQSMNNRMSDRSELLRWDAAVSFGLALARRCEHADVVSFSDNYYGRGGTKVFPQVRAESLLTAIKRFKDGGFFINAGTDTAGALREHYRGHDRVLILTDEQAGGNGDGYRLIAGRRQYVGPGNGGDLVTAQMPADRPLYTYNLAGYRYSHAPTDRNRLILGGLTDAMFSIIPTIEAGGRGGWPWDLDSSIGPLPTYEQPHARTVVAPAASTGRD